jgi:hypothetical protein
MPTPDIQEEDNYERGAVIQRALSQRAARPASMLMEGIKEELFQLEVELKRGEISKPAYDDARAALDHTLGRAPKREVKSICHSEAPTG